jgi:multidrug efflux pump subunit AcrA (membrane-fusion protein)
VSVQIASRHASVQIPRDAIVLREEGGYVFRINGDNTAHKVMVEVGEGSREWVSVSGNLNAGDWVAVRGVERLQDGQTVSRQGS